jgi:hypothetical protein
VERYRRRVEEVDAIQLTDDADWLKIAKWCGARPYPHSPGDLRDQMFVPTVTGGVWACVNNWIIRNTVHGGFSVLSAALFHELYEIERS